MVQFQMFHKLVFIPVLFPMLLQMEILKIVCVLVFEQRAAVADIELQQMADDTI
jgi:sensor domain CHASE-containing protein